MKRPLANLGALSVSIVVAFAVGEWFCRIAILKDKVPASESRFIELMKYYHGEPPRIPNRPVVLGLADSFGCDGEIGGNFFNYLQAGLESRGFSDSVVNLSVTGYQTSDELGMLQAFGGRYHPQVVIQAFYVGDDTRGNPPGRFVAAESGVAMRELPFSLFRPGTWVLPTFFSRTWRLWAERHAARAEGAMPAVIPGGGPEGRPQYMLPNSRAEYLRQIREELRHFRLDYPKSTAWAQVRDASSQMIRLSRAMGAKYVLVALPDELQVEDAHQEALFKDGALKRWEYDFALPQKLLKAFADEQGVAFIDLYPKFREKGHAGGLYLYQNTHWSEAGNRLAGETLAEALASSGLLSRPRGAAYATDR